VREEDAFHQNQKPLPAIKQITAAFTKEGDLILDPFLGSGTTLRAAKELNCRAIGIEIEERYCQTNSAGESDRIAKACLLCHLGDIDKLTISDCLRSAVRINAFDVFHGFVL
jgi:tRNA G10  N-methylase Trm11